MESTAVNPFLGSHLNGDSSPEPRSRPHNASVQPARDDLDDLFDYDPDIDDIFRDVDTNMDAPAVVGKGDKITGRNGASNTAGLGIDEEIRITRKKRVNVKLDEDRLLSQAGIPKLRRIAKERLRFRGKGHEYSDAARILSLYQLWLDDLYPKAKFADALAIIEKLGHSKKMQIMRKTWVESNAPRTTIDKLGDTNSRKTELDVHNLFGRSVDKNKPDGDITTGIAAQESIFGAGPQNINGQRTPPGASDSVDLYSSPKVRRAVESTSKLNAGISDSLFFSDDEAPEGSAARKSPRDVVSGEHEMPEENELDALLNEGTVAAGSKAWAEEFDDEMEVMMEMDNM